ncbi:hypothetical protein AB0F71_29395 [Kitasatospora sp. NPDC028055]|uniref:hypothetical protein n=1 Tax=Kitasatospora sp. NPDC028055 TaxID=3155653 RepID=UPI0033D9F87F
MSAIVMTDRIRLLRAAVFAALCVAMAAAAHVAMAGAGVSAPVLLGAFGAVLGLTWLLAGKRRGIGVISAWMLSAQAALHLFFEHAATLGRGGGGLGRLAGTDWAALLLCNPDRAADGLSPAELARMAGIDPDVPPTAGSLRPMAGMHHVAMTGTGVGPGVGPASGVGTGTADGAAMDMGMPGMPGMTGSPGTAGMPGTADMPGMSHALPTGPAHGMAHGMAHDMAHGMSPGMTLAHVLAALACALLLWRGDAALVRVFELLAALGAVVAGALLLPLLTLLARPFGYRPPVVARPADRPDGLPRSVLLTHAVVRRGPPAFALAC